MQLWALHAPLEEAGVRRCTFNVTRTSKCGKPAYVEIGNALAFCDYHEQELMKNIPLQVRLEVLGWKERA